MTPFEACRSLRYPRAGKIGRVVVRLIIILVQYLIVITCTYLVHPAGSTCHAPIIIQARVERIDLIEMGENK